MRPQAYVYGQRLTVHAPTWTATFSRGLELRDLVLPSVARVSQDLGDIVTCLRLVCEPCLDEVFFYFRDTATAAAAYSALEKQSFEDDRLAVAINGSFEPDCELKVELRISKLPRHVTVNTLLEHAQPDQMRIFYADWSAHKDDVSERIRELVHHTSVATPISISFIDQQLVNGCEAVVSIEEAGINLQPVCRSLSGKLIHNLLQDAKVSETVRLRLPFNFVDDTMAHTLLEITAELEQTHEHVTVSCHEDQFAFVLESDSRTHMKAAAHLVREKLLQHRHHRIPSRYALNTYNNTLHDGNAGRIARDHENLLGNITVHCEVKQEGTSACREVLCTEGAWSMLCAERPTTPAEEGTVCPLCGETDHVRAPACGHIICEGCLKTWCLLEAQKPNALFCYQGRCGRRYTWLELATFLRPSDLRRILDVRVKYYILHRPLKFMPCIGIDCGNFLVTDDNDTKALCCLECATIMCTVCRSEYHPGHSCDDIRRAASAGMAGEDGKQCPKCKTFLFKEDGCDHIECPICGSELCWQCATAFSDSEQCYRHLWREHGQDEFHAEDSDENTGHDEGDADNDHADDDDGGHEHHVESMPAQEAPRRLPRWLMVDLHRRGIPGRALNLDGDELALQQRLFAMARLGRQQRQQALLDHLSPEVREVFETVHGLLDGLYAIVRGHAIVAWNDPEDTGQQILYDWARRRRDR